MKIYLASSNSHKAGELRAIFGAQAELLLPKDAGISFEADETGATFAENSLIKARYLMNLLIQANIGGDFAVLGDDSGICVDALGGRPGIFSARYGGEALSSGAKNARLLAEMAGVAERGCRFVCAMTLLLGPERYIIAQETLEGEIALEEHGAGGFGYDPIVFLPQLGKTVAELSDEEKNRLSHRAKSAAIIKNCLTSS